MINSQSSIKLKIQPGEYSPQTEKTSFKQVQTTKILLTIYNVIDVKCRLIISYVISTILLCFIILPQQNDLPGNKNIYAPPTPFLKSASSILHAALKAFCPNPTYLEGGNNKGHKINAHTENYDILKLN